MWKGWKHGMDGWQAQWSANHRLDCGCSSGPPSYSQPQHGKRRQSEICDLWRRGSFLQKSLFPFLPLNFFPKFKAHWSLLSDWLTADPGLPCRLFKPYIRLGVGIEGLCSSTLTSKIKTCQTLHRYSKRLPLSHRVHGAAVRPSCQLHSGAPWVQGDQVTRCLSAWTELYEPRWISDVPWGTRLWKEGRLANKFSPPHSCSSVGGNDCLSTINRMSLTGFWYFWFDKFTNYTWIKMAGSRLVVEAQRFIMCHCVLIHVLLITHRMDLLFRTG